MDKREMKECFIIARHNFDRELRSSKRKYAFNKAHELAYTKNTNMTCFSKKHKTSKYRKTWLYMKRVDHLTNNLDRMVYRSMDSGL